MKSDLSGTICWDAAVGADHENTPFASSAPKTILTQTTGVTGQGPCPYHATASPRPRALFLGAVRVHGSDVTKHVDFGASRNYTRMIILSYHAMVHRMHRNNNHVHITFHN